MEQAGLLPRIVSLVLMVFFGAINIVLIQSKLFILVLAATIFVLYFFTNGTPKKFVRSFSLVAVLLIVVAFVFYPQIIPDYIYVFLNRYLGVFGDAVSSITAYDRYTTTYSMRGTVYDFAFDLFLNHPLFGVGFGNYKNYAIENAGLLGGVTQWKRLLASFDAISVRDLYSKNAIGKITDTPIEVVVDPTMLLECDFEPISAHKGRHIALYISDKKFSDKEKAIKLIKQFANNKKEVIVSLGLWTKWADENFVDSHIPPFNYYAGADYVITNTFHGTVFAILQQKQFVAFVGRNRKIVELLDMLNLNERIVNEEMNIEQFNNILDGQIDYMTVNNSLNRIRTQSRDYLRDSL